MRQIAVYILLLFVVAFLSCGRESERDTYTRLSQWDKEIDRYPQRISDSLKSVNTSELSRRNKAYYNLLKTITDDKTYVNFTNDSLITTVVDYYRLHHPQNIHYIRSLAYQGIVRTRMGVRDSTVYEPLREADKLLQSHLQPDPSLGYIINYFLGNIHYNNRNYTSADEYFQHTLGYAREEKDSIHVFDAFFALYWNEMEQKDFDKGKNYLDSISEFYLELPGKDYFILNAQAIYYDVMGDPNKALEKEKEVLSLGYSYKELVDLSRIYYNISDRFNNLNQLDSAMLYAQMAIDKIEDSSYVYNHLYYDNVANIAEKQENFLLANDYRKKSSNLYKSSVRDRLDTQIVELEKKYDLTEAENAILRGRQNNLVTLLVALSLVVLLTLGLMINWRKRKNDKMQLMIAEHKVQQQELQANNMKEEAQRRKWLLQLYSHISDRLTFLQEEFEQLTQRYVSSQPKVYTEMQKILKSTNTDLRDISKSLVPDNDTFYSYTRMNDELNLFNANEKMLLMLLACNADNRQLATFMNTTIDSIRVRKSQLKKKMAENALDTSIFFD